MKKFWLGVVSKEHVMRGVTGNFAQVCHGKSKSTPFKRTKSGDGFVYYSPTFTSGRILEKGSDEMLLVFCMQRHFATYYC